MNDSAARQLTPQTAPHLVAALQQLAARGRIGVTADGVCASDYYEGNLACEYRMGARAAGLCHFQRGLVMPSPVQPAGFTPQYLGEMVAYFEVGDDFVLIRYQKLRY